MRYNPRTHVFDYGGTTRTERRERYTIEEFCKYMRHHHRASYKAVRLPEALRRGLVVSVDGATVDGVLRTSRGPVAVELLGYSPTGDRGDVMTRDFALRKRIKPALYDLLNRKHYSLTLWYREIRRTAPRSHGTVKAVPKSADFGAIVEELEAVLTNAPLLDFNRFLSIRFLRGEIARKIGTYNGTLYLDASRFPVCAAHLEHIGLQGLCEDLIPQVDSNLKAGFVGLSGGWLREQLATKARKSTKSRVRANGSPLWLIVHCDGRAIHQTVPEPHRDRAVELCRDALAGTAHEFDRVYWADRTGYLDAAWIRRAM